MDQILEKLFESAAKARILRLFMHNPDESFIIGEIAKRTQVHIEAARKELGKLVSADIIKQRIAKKEKVFQVNSEFPLLSELRDLVIKSSTASRKNILQQMRGMGRVKLAVLSGVFINSDTARTDILIVGDDIKKSRLTSFLKRTESELGKPIQHTLMDTEEFRYRMDMYDRFLRDILEYPHEKLINRLDV